MLMAVCSFVQDATGQQGTPHNNVSLVLITDEARPSGIESMLRTCGNVFDAPIPSNP